jgi:hypothetical protein
MFLWDRGRRTAGELPPVTARRASAVRVHELARPTTAPVARLPAQFVKRPHPQKSNRGDDDAGDAADDPLDGHPGASARTRRRRRLCGPLERARGFGVADAVVGAAAGLLVRAWRRPGSASS